MLQKSAKLLFATTLSLALINTVDYSPNNISLSQPEAYARSSGGRSGGGSFRSAPSRSSNPGSRSNPSYNNNPGYGGGGGGVVIIPGGGGYGYGGYGGGIFPMLLVLGFFGLIGFLVLSRMLQGAVGNGSNFSNGNSNNELENDIVTVSKLQVALLSNAQGLQSQLSQISLETDTNTPNGLLELLQESSLLLLRNSESWSHVLASSQSTNINEAEQLFNKLSLQERSNFSAETLTNVNGKVGRKDLVVPGLEEDPSAYIVVTLLVGTADDKPLFKDIRTLPELQEALQRVASIPADYLMSFELLWSPQDEKDSLTYDELLTEYTNMVQLA